MAKITKRTLRRQARREASAGGVQLRPGSAWIDKTTSAVDPEKFAFAVQAYMAAAMLTMPTENVTERHAIHLEDQVIRFADNPLNRGMLAVRDQLREAGVADSSPYLWRVMHLGDLFAAAERFGHLMVDQGDGTYMMSDAVLHAAATARMVYGGDDGHTGFDIDDVIAVAQQYERERSDTGQAQV